MQDFFMYLKLGWEHIISKDAIDHQLFILALIAIYVSTNYQTKEIKRILVLVTAFTIGHTITLVLSALNAVKFPTNWVEFLIPCTIAFTAFYNLLFSRKEQQLIGSNYYLALIFGLVHGMGFANTVRMMLAKEQDIMLPLFGFNVGLEVGQLIVVVSVLLVFFIFSKLINLQKKHWILFTSIPILLFSIKMAIERIP